MAGKLNFHLLPLTTQEPKNGTNPPNATTNTTKVHKSQDSDISKVSKTLMRSQCCRQTPSPILSEKLRSVPGWHGQHAHAGLDCELESVAETPHYYSKYPNYGGSSSSRQASSSRRYGSSSTASAQLAPFSGTHFTCFTAAKVQRLRRSHGRRESGGGAAHISTSRTR